MPKSLMDGTISRILKQNEVEKEEKVEILRWEFIPGKYAWDGKFRGWFIYHPDFRIKIREKEKEERWVHRYPVPVPPAFVPFSDFSEEGVKKIVSKINRVERRLLKKLLSTLLKE